MHELGVSVLVKLIDGVTSPMRNVTRNFEALRHSAEKGKELFEFGGHNALASAGMKEFAEHAKRIIEQPVEVAEGYERAMARVSARLGATSEDVEKLEGSMESLEAGPTAAAGAMEALAHAGRSVDEILSMMPAISKVAKIDNAELGMVADSTTRLLRLFKLEASDTTQTLDTLAAGSAKSGTSISELMDAMRNAAETGSTLGVSLSQMTALIATLAQTGRTGFKAGSVLEQVFKGLESPPKEAQLDMSRLGIKTAGKNPIEVLGEMWTRTAKLSDATRLKFFKEVFGDNGGAVAQQLARQAGSGALQAMADEMGHATGKVDTLWGAITAGAPGAATRLAEATEKMRIAVGGALSPAVGMLSDLLAKLLGWIGTTAKEYPALTAGAFGSVAALAALATVITGVVATAGVLASGLGVVTVALGIKTTGVVLLGGALKGLGVGAAAVAAPVAAIGFAVAGVGAAIYELVEHWGDLKLIWNEAHAMTKPSSRGVTEWEKTHGGARPLPETWTDANEKAFQAKRAANEAAAKEAAAAAGDHPKGEVHIKIDSEGRARVTKLGARNGLRLSTELGHTMQGG